MSAARFATPVTRYGSGPQQSLAAVTGTGAGSTIEYGQSLKDFGVQLVIAGGTLSALSVTLQGSLDGTNWFTLGSAITTTTSSYTAITGNPVCFVRLNVGTFTVNTGSPTVTGLLCGI